MRDFFDSIAKFFGYDFWDWGIAAEWIGAIGTAGALFWALVLFANERKSNVQRDADSLVGWLSYEYMVQPDKSKHLTCRVTANNTGHRPIPSANGFIIWEWKGERIAKFFRLSPRGGDNILASGAQASGVANLSADIDRDKIEAYVFFNDPQGKLWFRNLNTNKYLSERKGLKLRKEAADLQRGTE